MKTCRAFLFSFFVLANSAFANTGGSDLTDLWWNANESGWGVTATHQGDVLFLTFFVYDTSNRPTFYTGQATYVGLSSQGQGVFSGPMFQTTGPWLGTFFNPNAVGIRQVGTVTFNAFVETATMTYSIDGTLVSKALTRQTFRNNNLTGDYAGALRTTNSGCSNPLNNATFETIASIRIAHSGNAFSMVSNDGVEICTYSGNYTQTGRMGASVGSYSCPGRTGSYNIFEIEATPRALSGRVIGSSTFCSQFTGHFGFAKRL